MAQAPVIAARVRGIAVKGGDRKVMRTAWRLAGMVLLVLTLVACGSTAEEGTGARHSIDTGQAFAREMALLR